RLPGLSTWAPALTPGEGSCWAPYRPLAFRRGDRTSCLYRDAAVVITGWTGARVEWPRCRPLESGGGSGVLVEEELLRAIHTESSLALQYWFGVSEYTVWRWRKAFGISRWGTQGSRELHQRVSEAGASKLRGKARPRELVRRTVETKKAKGYVLPTGRWDDAGWKPAEVALLGTLPDAEVTRRTGRTYQ